MKTRKSNEEKNDECLVKISDLREIIADLIKLETMVLVKKISALEFEVHKLNVTNQKLVETFSNNQCDNPVQLINSDEEIQSDSEPDLDSSIETVIATPADKVSEKQPSKKVKSKQRKNVEDIVNRNQRRRNIRGINDTTSSNSHTPSKNKNNNPKNTSNRRRSNKNIRGTDENNSSSFQAPPQKLWLHVGRCDKKTTEANVMTHLNKTWPKHQFEVKILPSQGSNVSFRVGVNYEEHLLQSLYEPLFWPRGIVVKKFKFFRGVFKSRESETTTNCETLATSSRT